VSQDGKALLDKLQRPLNPGSADSLMASANYSKAVHHVLDIIHEVLHHQRQLENIWQHRKVRLHQRLQLCVFQQDVQQNTYTNADKLLEAAEQLAQTGECDPEEIYQAAHQLEDRIQDFVRRVEQRKVLLDMSVLLAGCVSPCCVNNNNRLQQQVREGKAALINAPYGSRNL
ncbi:hypothetical protein XENOCAPTIV_012109, partial [Xenoophorus captivus]